MKQIIKIKVRFHLSHKYVFGSLNQSQSTAKRLEISPGATDLLETYLHNVLNKIFSYYSLVYSDK